MGFKRIICSGCAGMLCLLPMAYISFRFLDLTSLITGGLVLNLDEALINIGDALGPSGDLIALVASVFLGLFIILLFPIHWCLTYRPGDIVLLLAVILPWILCCVITSGLFAHSPRGGLDTSLAIGFGYLIPMVALYFIIPIVLGSMMGGGATLMRGLLDGLSTGLTDLPFLLAVTTAILEGTGVGAVFGAFIGSLKYKPEAGEKGKKKGKDKKKKSKKEKDESSEPSFAEKATPTTKPASGTDFCTNCGAKLTTSDEFCVNCGSKVKR